MYFPAITTTRSISFLFFFISERRLFHRRSTTRERERERETPLTASPYPLWKTKCRVSSPYLAVVQIALLLLFHPISAKWKEETERGIIYSRRSWVTFGALPSSAQFPVQRAQITKPFMEGRKTWARQKRWTPQHTLLPSSSFYSSSSSSPLLFFFALLLHFQNFKKKTFRFVFTLPSCRT